jgi:hypothetical protein
MDTTAHKEVGSQLAPTTATEPVEQGEAGAAGQKVFGPGSTAFSTYYYWHANGTFPQVRFVNQSVNANSRVFVNISEYSNDPQHRFIGAAKMAVYNIAPYDGGFLAWVEIDWGSPLNIRFDVLIDP